MQRVNLGKPYEEFIQKLVQSGYYASASEVLRDALRLKMEQSDMWQSNRLQQLVKEGLEDVEANRVIPYEQNFWQSVNEQVKINLKNQSPIPDHVRP